MVGKYHRKTVGAMWLLGLLLLLLLPLLVEMGGGGVSRLPLTSDGLGLNRYQVDRVHVIKFLLCLK